MTSLALRLAGRVIGCFPLVLVLLALVAVAIGACQARACAAHEPVIVNLSPFRAVEQGPAFVVRHDVSVRLAPTLVLRESQSEAPSERGGR